MAPSDNHPDLTEDAPDDAIDDALVAPSGPSVKELAAAEELMQAQRMEQIRAMQASAEPVAASEAEEDLATVASKGREYLMQKLRDHAVKTAAQKQEYTPPPMTDAMAARIREEQEAGRRAIARHEAQQAARPAPKKEVWDGENQVVARPGTLVPDPLNTAKPFEAGTKHYSPNA